MVEFKSDDLPRFVKDQVAHATKVITNAVEAKKNAISSADSEAPEKAFKEALGDIKDSYEIYAKGHRSVTTAQFLEFYKEYVLQVAQPSITDVNQLPKDLQDNFRTYLETHPRQWTNDRIKKYVDKRFDALKGFVGRPVNNILKLHAAQIQALDPELRTTINLKVEDATCLTREEYFRKNTAHTTHIIKDPQKSTQVLAYVVRVWAQNNAGETYGTYYTLSPEGKDIGWGEARSASPER